MSAQKFYITFKLTSQCFFIKPFQTFESDSLHGPFFHINNCLFHVLCLCLQSLAKQTPLLFSAAQSKVFALGSAGSRLPFRAEYPSRGKGCQGDSVQGFELCGTGYPVETATVVWQQSTNTLLSRCITSGNGNTNC